MNHRTALASKPVLYTFRRCPYAIRARLAIGISGVEIEMREVDLRSKPQAMLDCSPKGTVPVLQLADGQVIDESLDIMRWALAINDPDGWLGDSKESVAEALALIRENDQSFKRHLDDYKYAGQRRAAAYSPTQPPVQLPIPARQAEYYRQQAGIFLHALKSRLARHPFLMGTHPGLADAAIFPFVRQFAHVDKDWFYAEHAGPLTRWLDRQLQSALFAAVMKK